MQSFLIFAAALVASASTIDHVQAPRMLAGCPDGWIPFTNSPSTESGPSCLHLLTLPTLVSVTQAYADFACGKSSLGGIRGGHLVTIGSTETASTSTSLLGVFQAGISASSGKAYIGLRQQRHATFGPALAEETPRSQAGWAWQDSTSPANIACTSSGCTNLWGSESVTLDTAVGSGALSYQHPLYVNARVLLCAPRCASLLFSRGVVMQGSKRYFGVVVLLVQRVP